MLAGAIAASVLPVALGAAVPAADAHPARKFPKGVPGYVTKYAPIVYLYSGENFFPASWQAQLDNTTPQVDFEAVDGVPSPLTLDNLDQLNDLGDTDIYLTSNDDITTFPDWLKGEQPDENGATESVTNVVITRDHGDGYLDAFYMFFYAYDWGGEVLGNNLGNHVGDIEHMMVRFNNGTPEAVWYSQHANGEAFEYDVVHKQDGGRPVGFVANGTHANYAIPGTHDHTIPDLNLPFGLLEDHTDQGAMWDSVANAWFYSFDADAGTFAAYDESTPLAFLNFDGQWGDEQYPDDDPRQDEFFGFAKYASGPNGPKFKDLGRDDVCPDNGVLCIVRPILGP